MKYFWIFKITSPKIPNDCVVYYSGTNHKYPETQMKFYMKGMLKKWKENPKSREYMPYFPFAEDIMVDAEIIGQTALDNKIELQKYCAVLTEILKKKDL